MKKYVIKGAMSGEMIANQHDLTRDMRATGGDSMQVTDGFHTMDELYEFRKIYNAVLFNEWAAQGRYNVQKSIRHADGNECFGGGWFIVVATLPSGQISNHYELKDWDLFQCAEVNQAPEWDGHTSQDVLERLKNL